MRIGPSFNFPTAPPRTGVGIPAGFEKSDQQQSQSEKTAQITPEAPLSELIQAAEQTAQAREETRFYTMDRDLPLRGQEALSAYISTAQLNIQSEDVQLVGVDIYV